MTISGTRRLAAAMGTVAALLMFVSACETVQHRIQKHPAEFQSYPPEVRQMILEGRVGIGFDTLQAYLALGKPYRIASRSPDAETWVYAGYQSVEVIEPKSDWQYQREYKEAVKRAENNKRDFIPPLPYEKRYTSIPYARLFLYFDGGRLSSWEEPLEYIPLR